MAKQPNPKEEVVVLVKALPHVGDRHGETVCCAGVTREKKWRRLYPVQFRDLEKANQFRRWQWVTYEWIHPKDDRRKESRRVQHESIRPEGQMREQERAGFLASLIQPSVEHAYELGDTLTLVRPRDIGFNASKKTNSEILDQEKAYSTAASQFSFLTEAKKPIEPCPYKFTFNFKMDDDRKRNYTCDDWETSAMFFRWRREYGESQTLTMMKEIFEEKYPERGMVFALGTHSRRPEQWLLVGVIRLDETSQAQLF